MAHFLHRSHFHTARKLEGILFASLWALGLFSGGWVFRCSGGAGAAGQIGDLSLTAALGCALLPFLICACIVYGKLPWLLYGVGLIKAFLFSYVSCLVLAVWLQGGWLVKGLLLFSDSWVCIGLYGYCHRHLCQKQPFDPAVQGFYAAFFCSVAGIDYFLIAPLLQRVLS